MSLFQTRKLVKVEREPYNGPVITLPSSEPPAIVSPSQRKQKFQEHKKSGATRDLHRSGFELSGEWIPRPPQCTGLETGSDIMILKMSPY